MSRRKVADIPEALRELNKAFKFRKTEELPVFEKLGDASRVSLAQRNLKLCSVGSCLGIGFCENLFVAMMQAARSLPFLSAN